MLYKIVMDADGYNVEDDTGSYLYSEPLNFEDAYNAVRVLNRVAA